MKQEVIQSGGNGEAWWCIERGRGRWRDPRTVQTLNVTVALARLITRKQYSSNL